MYELPAGKGHRLGFHNGFDRLLSGWFVAGIATAWSGVPLIISDTSGGQTWGNAPPGLAGASGAIQTGAVSTGLNAPISGTGFNFFGNNKADIVNFRPVLLSSDGRDGRANPIDGLGYKNVDMSVSKETHINERFSTKFAADFFNLFNHPNFANPISNLNALIASGGSIDPTTGRVLNPGNFGRIISTSNNPRILQFALKFNF